MPEQEMNLDDSIRIKNLDKSGMYSNLHSIAKDTLESYDKAKKDLKIQNNNINNIVGAGMGGAGMPLIALQHLLKDELTFPYVVSQDYVLPRFANYNTALIAISQSGESEVIISQYHQAREKDLKIVVVGMGGKLIEMAIIDCFPYFTYSSNVPARASFGFIFGSTLAFLENIGAICDDKRESLLESVEVINKLNKNIGLNVLTKDNKAKKIALSLKNHIPVLYVEPPFGSLGSRFTKMLNENAGMFALYNQFSELRHNEIMSWARVSSYKSKFIPILLRDNKEYSKMEEEINEIKKVISGKVIDINLNVSEIRAEGKSKIARFFYLLHYVDMITYYLAILFDKDPSITRDIEQLKKELRNSGCLKSILDRYLDKELQY